MLRLVGGLALLGLMSCGYARATVVDFSFSGVVSNSNGAIGTASGQLTFFGTGTNIPAEALITVTGVPGFTSSQSDFAPIFNRWTIATNGDLLYGFLDSSTSGGGGFYGEDFSVSDGVAPAGNFFTYYNPDGYFESFSGIPTFNQISAVPEPRSLAVFVIGLLSLGLMKRGAVTKAT